MRVIPLFSLAASRFLPREFPASAPTSRLHFFPGGFLTLGLRLGRWRRHALAAGDFAGGALTEALHSHTGPSPAVVVAVALPLRPTIVGATGRVYLSRYSLAVTPYILVAFRQRFSQAQTPNTTTSSTGTPQIGAQPLEGEDKVVGRVLLTSRLGILVVPGVLHGQLTGVVRGVEVGVVAEVLSGQRGMWAGGQIVALTGAALVVLVARPAGGCHMQNNPRRFVSQVKRGWKKCVCVCVRKCV